MMVKSERFNVFVVTREKDYLYSFVENMFAYDNKVVVQQIIQIYAQYKRKIFHLSMKQRVEPMNYYHVQVLAWARTGLIFAVARIGMT